MLILITKNCTIDLFYLEKASQHSDQTYNLEIYSFEQGFKICINMNIGESHFLTYFILSLSHQS
jgi:hypothetical protein